jgi:hypothetical protein
MKESGGRSIFYGLTTRNEQIGEDHLAKRKD